MSCDKTGAAVIHSKPLRRTMPLRCHRRCLLALPPAILLSPRIEASIIVGASFTTSCSAISFTQAIKAFPPS